MTLRRRILDYSIAAILLILPVVLLRAGLKESGDLNGFERGVLRISSPLQAAVSWVVEGIGGVWNRYVYLVDVEEENRELRDDNERLRDQLAAARRQVSDSHQLEDLIQVRRRAEAETVGARVIASSINPQLRVVRLRIDRGKGEVEVGMPVVDGAGLVGVVRRVFGDYSDVQLVTDPASEVQVRAPRTGAVGNVFGLGRDDAYRCKLRVEKRSGTVKVGDDVVTRDLGAFPAGIQVGKVAEVTSVDYTLYQEVEIEPTAEFASLSRVLVVLSPPPPPDPDGDQPAPPRPAHKVGSF